MPGEDDVIPDAEEQGAAAEEEEEAAAAGPSKASGSKVRGRGLVVGMCVLW